MFTVINHTGIVLLSDGPDTHKCALTHFKPL